MDKLSNKIQIPKITNIATILAVGVGLFMALLYLAIFLMMLIFDSDFSIDIAIFYLPIVFGYGFASVCLLKKWKIGWYAGVAVFGAMALFWLKNGLEYNFPITDVEFLAINSITFILLLFDRKNYFVAAEGAKKTGKIRLD